MSDPPPALLNKFEVLSHSGHPGKTADVAYCTDKQLRDTLCKFCSVIFRDGRPVYINCGLCVHISVRILHCGAIFLNG